MADDTVTTTAAEDDEAPAKGKPRSSKTYLNLINEGEKAFRTYQDKCDTIDKWYADMEKLANDSRDRQFAMFWANMEVTKPSIYSRPPVPVVVPRFKSQKALPRETSTLLERVAVTNFEQEHIDDTMRLVRDDLAISSRGAAWVRYETADEASEFWERCRIDHVDRKDFLHDPARKWSEVEWVARGSWIGRKSAKKRFGKEKAALLKFELRKGKDDDTDQTVERKARAWELWHKTERKIVWVSPGVDEVLDETTPKDYLDLTDFFPCPQPAFGTLQRRSLKPVPDFLQYKDQIEEINELTARISALSEALRLKGFYAGGAEDVADAIEKAIKSTENGALLIPVSNFAAMGGSKLADVIVWLPVDMVASTITQLVALRKQLIDDVYQITGLSDIMRGSTDPAETLGAQQLKTQYGSIRVRDRQNELVRFARDLSRLMCEVIAENFATPTLVAMSQTELPKADDIQKQAIDVSKQMQALSQQIKDAQQDPATMQAAQADPEKAKQMLDGAQQQMQAMQKQLEDLKQTVTIDAVVGLLRAEKLRPFILDIETDSTIQPDEDAAKQRVTEFTTAVGGFIAQSFPMVQQEPKLAPFVGSMLKFIASPFRASREMESTIEELVDQMKTLAGQPKAPDPKAAAAQADAQAKATDAQVRQQEAAQQAEAHQADIAAQQADEQHKAALRGQEVAAKQAEADAKAKYSADENAAKLAQINAKATADAAKASTDAVLGQQQIRLGELAIAQAEQNGRLAAESHSQAMTKTTTDAAAKRTEAGLPGDDAWRQMADEAVAGREANNEIVMKLAEAVGKQGHEFAQAIETLASALIAPKRIVKDNDGRPVGVETVVQ